VSDESRYVTSLQHEASKLHWVTVNQSYVFILRWEDNSSSVEWG